MKAKYWTFTKFFQQTHKREEEEKNKEKNKAQFDQIVTQQEKKTKKHVHLQC